MMKIRMRWAEVLCVTGVLLVGGVCAAPLTQAQSAPPASVVDYYLRLPHRYFEITQAERENGLLGTHRGPDTVVDTKNDYIYSPGDAAQPTLTVALFRDRGRVLVAVLADACEDAPQSLDFLRYSHGQWVNVTKSVLPLPFNNRLTYLLPRRGTTIRVRDAQGGRVYDLQWKNGRFHVV